MFSVAQVNVYGFGRFNSRIRSLTSIMVGSSFRVLACLALQCIVLGTKLIW